MTKGLLNSIYTKDRIYKLFVQTDTNNILYETIRLNLKTYQHILKNSIKEAKQVYHFNLFSKYKEDVKKTWSINKDALGKTNSQYINCEFEVDSRTITDPAEMANEFNKYFVSIVYFIHSIHSFHKSHNTQPDKSYNEYLRNRPNCHLTFSSI